MTDRELDALVAEKVMGWEWAPFNYKPNFGPMEKTEVLAPAKWSDPNHLVFTDYDPSAKPNQVKVPITESGRLDRVFPQGPNFHQLAWVPLFSTDISAAWQVVEKMREGLRDFHMESYDCEKKGKGYFVAFWGNFDDWFDAPDASPARAICLAALRAVGVEI